MSNVEQLKLNDNNLGSLPSEIAQLTKLEGLYVKRLTPFESSPDRRRRYGRSGLTQPALGTSSSARSAGQSEETLCEPWWYRWIV
jgi:hypothetical protein